MKVLIGYAPRDLEDVDMGSFFKSWKVFNRRLDKTITGVTPTLRDRVGLFHAYIVWNASTHSSDNLIV